MLLRNGHGEFRGFLNCYNIFKNVRITHFVVEAVERCGPNVMDFQVATGERRWHIVRAYVAPEDKVTMETVVAATGQKPPGAELMVAGDFNVDILAPEGNRRAEKIATDLATAGVEDIAQHFMPRRR